MDESPNPTDESPSPSPSASPTVDRALSRTQSRREKLLQFAGVYDVKEGVLGSTGELTIGDDSRKSFFQPSETSQDANGQTVITPQVIPGRRTGSVWMQKKRQKFPYSWQKRLFVLLPTEMRLRYFKEDEDALTACGCVDLRSLKWSGVDPADEAEELLQFEARQIDKRRVHGFELKPSRDKADGRKDRGMLYDLIKDRLDYSAVQPSLGISYALDNELKQKLAVEDKGVLVVQTWEDGPCHKAGLLSYVAARKGLEQSKSLASSESAPESKIGDIIQGVNGVPIGNPKELFREIRKLQVSEEATLTVKRGDVVKDFVVILGSAQSYPDSYNIPIGCRIRINKGN